MQERRNSLEEGGNVFDIRSVELPLLFLLIDYAGSDAAGEQLSMRSWGG